MRHAFVESIGAAVFLAAATLPLGCVTAPPAPLQPLVAVAGAYSLSAPSAKPAPSKCENCGGRGVVGDGTIEVPCPVCRPSAAKADPSCKCDGKGYTITAGTRWKCQCKDCKCTAR